MTWWAVDLTVGEADRDATAAWLVARTGHAVEERADGTIVGFVPAAAAASEMARDVSATFGPRVGVALREMEAVDWTVRWRDGIGVRRVGRLALVPSWLPVPEGTPHVLIDPEMAFGSGEHGSTRAALALLDRALRPGDFVLDLGSGSGILAIAAVRLGARGALGIEVDAEAIPVAERNAERNRVADQVRFLEGDALELAPLAGPADLVVSNILRGPNIQLLPAIRAALRPGGLAIFSGMETPEADLFRPVLAAEGFLAGAELVDEGWWAIVATRT
ncbi:MAG TPA: 50S ribosomal protein L11 methyltransferase [Gemmatimonadales bacterium]